MAQQCHSEVQTDPGERKTCPRRTGHSSTVHNSQAVKTTERPPTDGRGGKQVCAYVMKCYPALKRKKKKNAYVHCDLDEP